MRSIFIFLLVFTTATYAQKSKRTDKSMQGDLQKYIGYLADDRLEGRRTGTNGEKLAYTFIADQFRNIGLIPKGDSSYFQSFEVFDGKQIFNSTHFIINGNDLALQKDFFPMIYSANASVEAVPTIAFNEKGMPWFLDIKTLIDDNKTNPHFDLTESIKIKATDAASKGATAFIIYNSSGISDELKFEGKQKAEQLTIPVVYVTKEGMQAYLNDASASVDMKLKVAIGEKKRYGHNVAGYIDNGTAYTIIIGAHYDHLGYGEDHNSLWTGPPSIHNGADDNASGTAAVIELAKLLKQQGLKRNNYLFICFSGEELGLFGSKYFTEHPTIDLSKVDYMINMDMIGRFNDSTKAITLGGYGTSPAWGQLISSKEKDFTIKFDSSGTGPSDHTSFYRKDIPVLFFFTGIHKDYHKPSDDVDKINFPGEVMIIKYIYGLIMETGNSEKLAFAKTREQSTGGMARFTVSLGIMPDYTFNGNGVRVDGISEGKLAQRIGLKPGDIVTEMGAYKFSDVTSYMDVLAKFKKGDATKIKVLRGKEELTFDIIF